MSTIRAADVAEVLAVLGNHDAEPSVTETVALIARLAGGEVRALRLAADLSPRRAAGQVMRALHRPRVVSGVLASDNRSRPLWR